VCGGYKCNGLDCAVLCEDEEGEKEMDQECQKHIDYVETDRRGFWLGGGEGDVEG
jgi:hypothetical protein